MSPDHATDIAEPGDAAPATDTRPRDELVAAAWASATVLVFLAWGCAQLFWWESPSRGTIAFGFAGAWLLVVGWRLVRWWRLHGTSRGGTSTGSGTT